MSRFSVWLLCCAIILIMLAVERPDVNIRSLLSMFAFLGAPLILHWRFSSEKSSEDVKDA
jgi:hypothetical protein